MSLLFSCALATNWLIRMRSSNLQSVVDQGEYVRGTANYLLASCQIIDMTTRSTLPKNTPSAQVAEQNKISFDIDRRRCRFAKSSPAGENQYSVFVC
ncbi:unnamed protein product [Ceratitis capitata]|uniref:(Mediterranean fruit fly) hypothetical protein n=1 Tax=Ceratitis capitata TaxID=7213 RepID=A0A811UV81_CERCA|nr:unnamed protein product [Ceratitis capitata]CAD7001607.1 unnamed protein product [Ceratitis capitata]